MGLMGCADVMYRGCWGVVAIRGHGIMGDVRTVGVLCSPCTPHRMYVRRTCVRYERVFDFGVGWYGYGV